MVAYRNYFDFLFLILTLITKLNRLAETTYIFQMISMKKNIVIGAFAFMLTWAGTSVAFSKEVKSEKLQEPQTVSFAQIKQIFPSAQNEGQGNVGNVATIDLKDGLIFLNGKDGDKLLQSWGNLPSVIDGLVMNHDADWVITFQFDPIGYVKDDEKEDLDADEILEAKKEAQKEANKNRTKQGLSALHIVRWVVKPHYNEKTNNLEWAMLLRDDQGAESINFEIRLLGRKGVMNATLLCSPEKFEEVRPIVDSALAEFHYTPGNKYAEYRKGDKIAEYGLLGLMGAGGAFVIWKFWKPIAVGIVALGATIKKFFGGLFGGKSDGRIS